MQLFLVKLQKEHDQDEQCVEHDEGEHHLVAKVDQVARNASLKWQSKNEIK